MKKIIIKTSKTIAPRSVQSLFRRMEWSDWWTLKDIKWYLNHSVYIVTAWHNKKLVGIGTLTGDGRINVQLDYLIVEDKYQGQGIGSEMLKRIVKKVKQLKPYWFQTDICEKKTEKLFAKFGFVKNKGQQLLMHKPTIERWHSKALLDRKKRKKSK